MDATNYDVRSVIELAGHSARAEGSDDRPLATTCGQSTDESTEPHYRVTIGDGFFNPPYRTWRVDILVHGEEADLSVREAPIPIPPPPPLDAPAAPFRRWVAPAATRTVPTRSLEAIRTTWNSDEIWHSPQGNTGCTDGRDSLLEACIGGRYAARDRHCGSDRKVDELWRALLRTVPAPPPGAWSP
ncbi:hypothetical protein [Lysobacter sp. TY2-98]|uniref:hypothetical protein n=1 Tax=Lysobacter sp. TY2-98 TaxID=2290922 RepID=UPI0013B42C9B|nr:hypothetical protein [Lysobacter sp. TY2-98]